MITSEKVLKEVNYIANDLDEYLTVYDKHYNFSVIKQYITQQENIKKKIKRYFELLNEDKVSNNQLYRNEFVKIVKELWKWSELNDNK